MSKEKEARRHVIKIVQSFHQKDLLNFYSLGLIGENVLIEPVQQEVHMLLVFVGVRGGRAKILLDKQDKTREGSPITLESIRVVVQLSYGIRGA